MKGPRIRLFVEVNTDAIPGWGDNPQDFVQLVQSKLDASIPHYEPKVTHDESYREEDE
jgi:hypothetical protein